MGIKVKLGNPAPQETPAAPDASPDDRACVGGPDPAPAEQTAASSVEATALSIQQDALTTGLRGLTGKCNIQVNLFEIAEEIARVQSEIDLLERQCAAEVAEAVDPATSKPKYSNETARKGAIAAAMATNPKVGEFHKKLKDLRHAQESLSVKKDYCNGLYQLSLAVLYDGRKAPVA